MGYGNYDTNEVELLRTAMWMMDRIDRIYRTFRANNKLDSLYAFPWCLHQTYRVLEDALDFVKRKHKMKQRKKQCKTILKRNAIRIWRKKFREAHPMQEEMV